MSIGAVVPSFLSQASRGSLRAARFARLASRGSLRSQFSFYPILNVGYEIKYARKLVRIRLLMIFFILITCLLVNIFNIIMRNEMLITLGKLILTAS